MPERQQINKNIKLLARTPRSNPTGRNYARIYQNDQITNSIKHGVERTLRVKCDADKGFLENIKYVYANMSGAKS